MSACGEFPFFSFFSNPCAVKPDEEPVVVEKPNSTPEKDILLKPKDPDHIAPPLVEVDEKSINSGGTKSDDDEYEAQNQEDSAAENKVAVMAETPAPKLEVIQDENVDMTFWEFLSSKIVIDFRDLGNGAFMIGLKNKSGSGTGDASVEPTVEDLVHQDNNAESVDNKIASMNSVLRGLKEAQKFFFYPELTRHEFYELEPSTSITELRNEQEPVGTVVLLTFQPQSVGDDLVEDPTYMSDGDETGILDKTEELDKEEQSLLAKYSLPPKALDASFFEIQDLMRSYCCVAFSNSSNFKESDAREMLNALVCKDDPDGVFVSAEEPLDPELPNVPQKEHAMYVVSARTQTTSPVPDEVGESKYLHVVIGADGKYSSGTEAAPADQPRQSDPTKQMDAPAHGTDAVTFLRSLGSGSFYEETDLDPEVVLVDHVSGKPSTGVGIIDKQIGCLESVPENSQEDPASTDTIEEPTVIIRANIAVDNQSAPEEDPVEKAAVNEQDSEKHNTDSGAENAPVKVDDLQLEEPLKNNEASVPSVITDSKPMVDDMTVSSDESVGEAHCSIGNEENPPVTMNSVYVGEMSKELDDEAVEDLNYEPKLSRAELYASYTGVLVASLSVWYASNFS